MMRKANRIINGQQAGLLEWRQVYWVGSGISMFNISCIQHPLPGMMIVATQEG